MLTVGSLFSGIGGIELGLERTGHFKTIWQVEIDDYATKILEKHWKGVKRYRDIRTVMGWFVGDTNNNGTSQTKTTENSCSSVREAQKGEELRNCESKGTSLMGKETDNKGCERRKILEYADLICGGFPCQDISVANPKGKGLEGSRSGLWFEFARIISEVRPKYVLVENVPALTRKGLDRVLGSLAEIGYDAFWDCLRASDFGYPHRRERIFIIGIRQDVADSASIGCGQGGDNEQQHENNLAQIRATKENQQPRNRWFGGVSEGSEIVPNSDTTRLEGSECERIQNKKGKGHFARTDKIQRIFQPLIPKNWVIEPRLGRVVNGISNRVDRLKCIGNAVVPACAEHIGKMILEYDKL